MKKPFLLLKNPKDILKLWFCIALSLSVLMLFVAPDEAVTVFAQNEAAPKSLFGLLSRLGAKG